MTNGIQADQFSEPRNPLTFILFILVHYLIENILEVVKWESI
jgi:hypothetical protein